jgi:hypothetical protein
MLTRVGCNHLPKHLDQVACPYRTTNTCAPVHAGQSEGGVQIPNETGKITIHILTTRRGESGFLSLVAEWGWEVMVEPPNPIPIHRIHDLS